MRLPGSEHRWKTKEAQRLLWDIPGFRVYTAEKDGGDPAKEQTENKGER